MEIFIPKCQFAVALVVILVHLLFRFFSYVQNKIYVILIGISTGMHSVYSIKYLPYIWCTSLSGAYRSNRKYNNMHINIVHQKKHSTA